VPEHKFKIGQTVRHRSEAFDRDGSGSVYRVIGLLPPKGGEYQYRIKNAEKLHERVVKESQLYRAA
jgi:hypothetical protein